MNPDTPKNNQRHLEVKLTALLLGELNVEEATALEKAIQRDPELARLHEQLKLTIGLVRETAATPPGELETPPVPLKLSEDRRQKLFAHFKTVAPKEFKRAKRRMEPILAAAACLAILIAVAALVSPNFVRTRQTSQANAIINNLRQLDSAKQQWALENGKSGTDVPTFKDIKPYLSRGHAREFKSVMGESYTLGRVEDSPVAELNSSKAKQRFWSLQPARPADKAPAEQLQLSANASYSPFSGIPPKYSLFSETKGAEQAGQLQVSGQISAPTAEKPASTGSRAANGLSLAYGIPPSTAPPTRPASGPTIVLPTVQNSVERSGEPSSPGSTQSPGQLALNGISTGTDRRGAVASNDWLLAESTRKGLFTPADREPGNAALSAGNFSATNSASALGWAYQGAAPAQSFSTRLQTSSRQASISGDLTSSRQRESLAYGGHLSGNRRSGLGGGEMSVPKAGVATVPIGGGGGGFGGAGSGGGHVVSGVGEAGGANLQGLALANKGQASPTQPGTHSAEPTIVLPSEAKAPETGRVFQFYAGRTTPGSNEEYDSFGVANENPTQQAHNEFITRFAYTVPGTQSNLSQSWRAGSAVARNDEKVPALGDIPMTGRLVRGEGEVAIAEGRSRSSGRAPSRTFGSPVAAESEMSRIPTDQVTAQPSASPVDKGGGTPKNRRAFARVPAQRPAPSNVQSANIVGYVSLPAEATANLLSAGVPIASSATETPKAEMRGTARERVTQRVELAPDSMGTTPSSALQSETLRQLKTKLLAAQKEVAGREIELRKLQEMDPAKRAPALQRAGISDTALRDLMVKSDQAQKKLASLRRYNASNSVELRDAQKNVADANQQLGQRVDEITVGLQNRLDLDKAAVVELNKKLESAEGVQQERLTAEQTDVTPPGPALPPPVPQPEVETRENAFSTFSLNVSDVSFKLAQASLWKGVLPQPGSIRSEEFINAFDYRDPEPAPGAPIGFNWERAADPFAHNRDLLRFSVKTAAWGRQPGRPLNLVLLLDNSGSMERADRVHIIHEALRVLASQLQPQDILSVVVFSRMAHLWVDGLAGTQAATVVQGLDSLTPQGGTNLEEAMKLAYATALRHYLANGVNRVVLLTDGAANLGNVDPETLKQRVEANRKQGIALDCFGIGWEGYNDNLLEVLSRNGDGRYGFINSPEEAATEFAGQLAGALRVAASDVKVQVEFNPNRVTAWRQVGYAKHQLTKEQFRDNTVDAAEIGAAESGNALYVIEVDAGGQGPLGTVRVRYRVPGTADYHEQAWDVPYTGSAVSLVQASPAMRLAAVAGAFSEWLATSPYAGEITPDRLLGYLTGVPEIYGADTRPKQLEWMIRQAGSIAGTAAPASSGSERTGF